MTTFVEVASKELAEKLSEWMAEDSREVEDKTAKTAMAVAIKVHPETKAAALVFPSGFRVRLSSRASVDRLESKIGSQTQSSRIEFNSKILNNKGTPTGVADLLPSGIKLREFSEVTALEEGWLVNDS